MTYGLVITARCDIAQDKYPVLNYLPVVPLQSWLKHDGLKILLEREKKNMDGRIRSILKEAGVSDTIMLSVDIQEIGRVHFPSDIGTKAEKKRALRFSVLSEEKQKIESLVEEGDNAKIVHWFALHRKSSIEELIGTLSKHDLAGYYLFERLTNEVASEPEAFVCLLRDVSAIPRSLAIYVSNGISRHVFSENYDGTVLDQLNIPEGELSMPIICIGSPTIEHVMQEFSYLFSRIGLDDPDTATIKTIQSICTTEGPQIA